MEPSEQPAYPPAQQPPVPPKKGLGTGAIIGIGCGGLVLLALVGAVVAVMMFMPKLKQFSEDAQKNPTRATATMMVSVSGGQMQLIAEDDVGKRYTIKEKKSGKLTTIYWSDKTKAPEVVTGDFSAIPAETAPAPAPETPEP
ncbi:MAG: hypothetical protein EOP87_24090 [Verrucomicrobiaceae bacterium]|nr:MAG: hypothetical protein EOP87_24090 [Verrucomicrobiaceae bacterium]